MFAIGFGSSRGRARPHDVEQGRAARALGKSGAVRVKATCRGANALPHGCAERAEDYIDAVVAMLPEVAASGLADAVDAFCETIGFDYMGAII